jgi:rod shape-determining protein MreC
MRNVFLFIRRYFHFLFFLALQVFCIYLIVNYNKYHYAVGAGYMNEITGRINEQYNKMDYYLQLKKTNEQLAQANESLKNSLKNNFDTPDTSNKIVSDSIPFDTLGNKRKWVYQSAKVVSNSVSMQNNYIVLSRGSNQQLKKDEAVIDPNNGVVGKIVDVSDNYAVVMSLLHKDSQISAILKNDSTGGGTVTWDGKEPNRLVITDIRKSAKVAKGDTVITSRLSNTFPPGLLLGTVEEIIPDKSSNNYIIKIKSAANFYNLQYVFAIDNLQKEAINKLLDKAKAKNQ